jgi:heat shock protein HslJ
MGGGRVAKSLAAAVVMALALSACLPFPPVVRGPEPTRSVFMPGVAESGASVSPLRPAPPVITASRATVEPVTPAPTGSEAGVATALQGPVWEWRASTFVDGTQLTPAEPSRYTVEFLPDGNALAQADCNFGTGLYRQEGDKLTIGAIGATKMACPADSLDSAFLAQLAKVEGYVIRGDELVLRLQDKAGEMRLRAQPGTLPPTATPTLTASPTPLPPPTATPTVMPPDTPTVAPSPTRFAPTPGLPATPTSVQLLETAFAGAEAYASVWFIGN